MFFRGGNCWLLLSWLSFLLGLALIVIGFYWLIYSIFPNSIPSLGKWSPTIFELWQKDILVENILAALMLIVGGAAFWAMYGYWGRLYIDREKAETLDTIFPDEERKATFSPTVKLIFGMAIMLGLIWLAETLIRLEFVVVG